MKYRKDLRFFFREISEIRIGRGRTILDWSAKQRWSRKKQMERMNLHEDQFVDEVAEIEGFTRLYAECAIVALWRCVELFLSRAILQVAKPAEAKYSYKHKEFCKCWKIENFRIQVALRKVGQRSQTPKQCREA